MSTFNLAKFCECLLREKRILQKFTEIEADSESSKTHVLIESESRAQDNKQRMRRKYIKKYRVAQE